MENDKLREENKKLRRAKFEQEEQIQELKDEIQELEDDLIMEKGGNPGDWWCFECGEWRNEDNYVRRCECDPKLEVWWKWENVMEGVFLEMNST